MVSRVRTGDVVVEGLTELRNALRDLGDGAQKELTKTNKSVAVKEADHARSAALTIGGVAAKSAPSLKASAGYKSASVTIDGQSYPYALGAAFGGQGRPTTMQFKPHITGGYFPFPQIGEDAEDIVGAYTDAINALIEKHFPIGI